MRPWCRPASSCRASSSNRAPLRADVERAPPVLVAFAPAREVEHARALGGRLADGVGDDQGAGAQVGEAGIPAAEVVVRAAGGARRIGEPVVRSDDLAVESEGV